MGLGVGDEFRQRFRGQFGVDDNDIRKHREQRNRRKFGLRIVAKRLEQSPVGRKRTDVLISKV